MILLFLSIIFLAHALLFVRAYTRSPQRIHLILTISGFAHLSLYYGYRTYAYFFHPAEYLDWVQYLRWSGAAMSVIGLPPLLKSAYFRIRARRGRASAAGAEAKRPPDRAG